MSIVERKSRTKHRGKAKQFYIKYCNQHGVPYGF